MKVQHNKVITDTYIQWTHLHYGHICIMDTVRVLPFPKYLQVKQYKSSKNEIPALTLDLTSLIA